MKRRFSVRAVALVILAALATAFAILNAHPAYVWPFGTHAVTLVVAVSFALGAGVGALGFSMLTARRRREAANRNEVAGRVVQS